MLDLDKVIPLRLTGGAFTVYQQMPIGDKGIERHEFKTDALPDLRDWQIYRR